MRRQTSTGFGGATPTRSAHRRRSALDARVPRDVVGERLPRHPRVLSDVDEGVDDDLAKHPARARVALIGRSAHDLRLGPRLVPRAAASPRRDERRAELTHFQASGWCGAARGRRLPHADRAGERGEHRHAADSSTEALREPHDQRSRRAHVRTEFVRRLARGDRERDDERRGIAGEARAARDVVLRDHGCANGRAVRLERALALGADDLRDLARHDVPVRVDGNEERAALEREARAATARRDALRAAHAERLALQIQELRRFDLATTRFDGFEQPTFHHREPLDLEGERASIAHDLPCRLEGERERRCRGPTEVVRRDRVHRLERCLRDQRAKRARILALPARQLHEVGDRQDELDALVGPPREQDAARHEHFDSRGERGHEQQAAGLRDAMQEVVALRGKPARIAHLGQADERARRLGGDVDSLLVVDLDADALDEARELGRRQGPQDDVETVLAARHVERWVRIDAGIRPRCSPILHRVFLVRIHRCLNVKEYTRTTRCAPEDRLSARGATTVARRLTRPIRRSLPRRRPWPRRLPM